MLLQIRTFFSEICGARETFAGACRYVRAIGSVTVTSAIDGFFCPRQDKHCLADAIPRGELFQT